MAINKEKKEQIIKEFGTNAKDTGRVEVQVAILTEEIMELTEHLKKYRKDFHSKTGLYKKVSKRNSLLKYLSKENPTRHKELIVKLKLRA